MNHSIDDATISQLARERERLVEETESYMDLPAYPALSNEDIDRCIEELRAIRLRIHAIDEFIRTAESKNSVTARERIDHEPRF